MLLTAQQLISYVNETNETNEDKTNFKLVSGQGQNNEITNVYIGDLLSVVMGRAKEGSAWITVQGHINIVAVALLIDAACIIITENSEVTQETIAKANEENLPIIVTKLSSYEVAKILVKLLEEA